MEDFLKLLEGNILFKLDMVGNVVELSGIEHGDFLGKPFIDMVSNEDKKRAAALFIDAVKQGFAQSILRLSIGNDYQIYEFKVIRKENDIYCIGKDLKTEEPSFVCDFLGNVVSTDEEWDCLTDKNLFDVVENRERLLDVVKMAIEEGQYNGEIAINEKEYTLCIKTTYQLEFFIEEDIFRILREILDAGDIKNILDKVKQGMDLLDIPYSAVIYDEEVGDQQENVVSSFQIQRRGDSIGRIQIYETLEAPMQHLVRFIALASSKAIERMDHIDAMLEDIALYKIDENGKIIYVNKKFEEITGYTIDELRTKNVKELAEGRDVFFKQLKTGKNVDSISMWKTKQGDIIARETARKINGETVVMLNDITDLKQQEAEVEFYNALLRHDVFNKNEIALGYMGLLGKTTLTKKQQDILTRIHGAVNDSNELIKTVRKAREIGTAEEKPKKIRLKRMLDDICETFSIMANEHKIKLSCDISNVEIEADNFASEVFSNVIKNAIQHAECSSITIEGDEDGVFYHVIIKDNGKGLSNDDVEHIFEKGWKKESNGSGLGLHIVKKLMERYGGHAEARSEKGKGTEIILTFRIAERKRRPQLVKIRI